MQRFPEFDDAVQDLSELLDRRLVVVNESMRVIAYSIHESPQERERLSHLLTHSSTWALPRTAKRPHSLERPPGFGPTCFIRLLSSDGHIIGHLLIPLLDKEAVNGKIDGEVVEAATRWAERLGDLLEAWSRSADEYASRSRELTINLVTGSPQQHTEAVELLCNERMLSISERYCVVVLGVDPRTATQQGHKKASLAVSHTVQFVNETSTATVIGGVLEDDVGVLVFPRPVVIPRLIRILERPALSEVRAGIGPLTTLNEIQRSYERARLTWRATYLAPDDYEVVVAWDQLGLDGTLARLPLEGFTVDDLSLTMRELLENITSAALLRTLEAYLESGGDAQQTARALKIHRSTLYYRLEKIRNAISGDLRDGVTRRELHTGMRIAKLANLL